MNGKIPPGTALGDGYKLRISYGPEQGPRFFTELVDPIGIGSIGTPFSIPFISISPTAQGVNFMCLSDPNLSQNTDHFFGSLNQSSNARLLANLEINEVADSWGFTSIKMYSRNNNGNWNSIDLPLIDDFGRFTEIPENTPVGYYIIRYTKTIGGKSLEYSYLFNFNTGNSGISNLSSESVCVGTSVEFEVSLSGIINNYPGSKYTVNWGDGSEEEIFTHNQLIEDQFVSHEFNDATCSSQDAFSNPEGKSFFKVDFKLFNKGLRGSCDVYSENGNGTFKLVNTSTPPTANFETNEIICEGTILRATDTSLSGAYGDSNICLEDYLKDWYVTQPGGTERRVNLDRNPDGTLVNPTFQGWLDENGDLQIPERFIRPGCWNIRLEVYNPINSGCDFRSQISKTVKVEATPEPSFTFEPGPEICKETKIVFTNTSNIPGEFGCQNPSFEWIATPVAAPATISGFSFTDETTSISANPIILFSEAGRYNVVLKITNACGEFESNPQQIDVLGAPKVVFDNDKLLVCRTNPDFNLDFSDGIIKPTFGEFPFAPNTYKWEVFEDDEITPADLDSYEFVDISTDEDPLPIIKYGIQAGWQKDIGGRRYWGDISKRYLTIMSNYKTQGVFSQFDINAQTKYDSFIFGLGFRGMMSKSEMKNYDSLIGLFGFSLNSGMVVGYSYDWMLSQVGANTKGSHEFSLRYQFLAGNQKKRGQRDRILKCFDYTF